MLLFKRASALALGVALALPAAASDLTIVFKTLTDGRPGTATQYMTTSKMRMSDGDHDTIVDTSAGRITSIDHAKKQYSEMTLTELETAAKLGGAKMAEMQAKQAEAMKNMPPALREKMAKMMGGAGGPLGSMKVTPGTGSRSVAGYATQEYVVTMGESMHMTLWNTTALVPPLEPGEMLRLQSMLNPMLKSVGDMAEEFKQLKGLTLASTTTVKVITKTVESSREATAVKTDAIPASVFAIPAGYKKVESPLAKMGKR